MAIVPPRSLQMIPESVNGEPCLWLIVGTFKKVKIQIWFELTLGYEIPHRRPIFSILFPSHFNDAFGKMHRSDTSNRTKVSQVSNTIGTPLDSILFHRFEAWSHKPPRQAPGLGSCIANFIVVQVDCRDSLVDFQRFGQGLCGVVFLSASGLKTSERNINCRMCYADRNWEMPCSESNLLVWKLPIEHGCVTLSTLVEGSLEV